MYIYYASAEVIWNRTEFDLSLLPEVEGVVYKLFVDPDPDWGFTETGRPLGSELYIYSENEISYEYGLGFTSPGFEWMNDFFGRTLEGREADKALRVWYNS